MYDLILAKFLNFFLHWSRPRCGLWQMYNQGSNNWWAFHFDGYRRSVGYPKQSSWKLGSSLLWLHIFSWCWAGGSPQNGQGYWYIRFNYFLVFLILNWQFSPFVCLLMPSIFGWSKNWNRTQRSYRYLSRLIHSVILLRNYVLILKVSFVELMSMLLELVELCEYWSWTFGAWVRVGDTYVLHF